MIKNRVAVRFLSAQRASEISKGCPNNNNIHIEWEKALPFEEIPGPKSLPLVGNMWRFFPKIGNLNGLQLHQLQYR